MYFRLFYEFVSILVVPPTYYSNSVLLYTPIDIVFNYLLETGLLKSIVILIGMDLLKTESRNTPKMNRKIFLNPK